MAASAAARRGPARLRACLLASAALWASQGLVRSGEAFAALPAERPRVRAFVGSPRARPGRRCGAERAATGDAAAGTPPELKPAGTVLGTTASVAKGMVGSGILSLAFGVAAFTAAPQGLGVGLITLLIMTLIAGYTFHMVAKVSAETGGKDFGACWAASMGEDLAWMPRVAVVLISGITCVVYSMILGDSLSAILRGLLTHAGPVVGWKAALLPWCTRAPILAVLTTGVLLPMCLAESYAGLARFSMLGIVACVYMAGFCVLRALDGTYAAGGVFFAACPVPPAALVPARQLADVLNMKTLVLLSNLGMAFMNHGAAPGMYQELAVERMEGESDEAVKQRKMKIYDRVIIGSFSFAGVVAAALMASGFWTFGANTNGFMLFNYAETDLGALLARVCLMASILTGFPLNFVLLRFEVAAALSGGAALGKPAVRALTVALLGGVTGLAITLTDLGKVQAAAGATLGVSIVFLFPALMARAMRRRGKWGDPRPWRLREVLLVGIGSLVGVLGLKTILAA